jgi:hypothetical protein
MALLAFGPLVVLHNALGVIVLLAAGRRLDRAAIRKMALGIVTNPLLLACAAGLSYSLTPWALPAPIERTLSLFGRFTLPAALLCIGASLASTPLRGQVGRALAATGIKLAAAPLTGLLVARFIGADATETAVALIMLACPTAVASYVLAGQLGGDEDLAASAVVVSTIGSIASLAAVVALV